MNVLREKLAQNPAYKLNLFNIKRNNLPLLSAISPLKILIFGGRTLTRSSGQISQSTIMQAAFGSIVRYFPIWFTACVLASATAVTKSEQRTVRTVCTREGFRTCTITSTTIPRSVAVRSAKSLLWDCSHSLSLSLSLSMVLLPLFSFSLISIVCHRKYYRSVSPLSVCKLGS